MRRVAIIVNLAAGGGQADRKWLEIEAEVLQKLLDDTIVIKHDGILDLETLVQDLTSKEGIDVFISAGGDGSLHLLVNALFPLIANKSVEYYIGAVGLGSSNDFHKPHRELIGTIPVRIDLSKWIQADLGRMTYTSEEGSRRIRYFLINSSLGVTAQANALFNREDVVLTLLKKRWPLFAINYTALKTIVHYRNYPAEISYGEHSERIRLSNLAILKNPHVSGSLSYGIVLAPDDGKLVLAYCHDMNKWELFQTLRDLSHGEFQSNSKRRSIFTTSVKVDVDQPVIIEADGEIYRGIQLQYSVLPGAINLLTNDT